jgi:hypothetical protein
MLCGGCIWQLLWRDILLPVERTRPPTEKSESAVVRPTVTAGRVSVGCGFHAVWQPGRDFRRLTDRLTGMIIAALGPLRARAKIPTEP